MRILDKDYDMNEVIRYTGGADNLNSVDILKFEGGKAGGSRQIRVNTCNGLSVVLLPDRGLDIAEIYYKGVKVSFISKNGITGQNAVNPHETEFLNYFAGGMLTTCGLRNAGPACREESSEYHPLHGRYNTIPAQETGIYRPDQETIEVTGTVKETALFGYNLKMHRCIRVNSKDSSIDIEDTLTNDSPEAQEIMLLYHYNFGFPFIQDGCRVEFEEDDDVIPRDKEAEKGMDSYSELTTPKDGYAEQVFFHRQKGDNEGFGTVKVINPHLGLSAELKYDTSVLPVLVHWKCMRSTDYALGLEPANCYVKGRTDERKNNTLKIIQPFDKMIFKTSLEFKKD